MTLGFGLLFEASRDAIVVSDARGKIVMWNRSATVLFGYEKKEALRMNVRDLVPPRLQEAHEEGIRRYRRTLRGDHVESGAAIEFPAVRKDGTPIVVELVLSEIPHHDRIVMAIVRDVTERAALRRDVEADRRRLRIANEGLESFASMVSHDLKEPIRALQAYLEDAHEEMDPSAPRELLERARVCAVDLSAMVRGLLEWSRANTVPVELESVSIEAVLSDAACSVMYHQLLIDHRASLVIEPDLPRVLATPGLLCQIVGNLITNSLKHSDKPSPTVHIYAAPPAVIGFVDIIVEDDGPGYPQNVLDEFRALDVKPRTIKGGFGLAITRRAIHRLGGELILTNDPAGGGRARLRFPAAALAT